jgi:hypothetical protein
MIAASLVDEECDATDQCARCHQVVERTSPIQRHCPECRRAIKGVRSREAVRPSPSGAVRTQPLTAKGTSGSCNDPADFSCELVDVEGDSFLEASPSPRLTAKLIQP